MNVGKKGFTVVELAVTMAVIAILVLLTAFAFGSWRSRTARAEVKNELFHAAAAIQNYKNFNNILPANQTTFNTQYKVGGAVTLTYIRRANGLSYCLRGVSAQDSAVSWYIDSLNNTSQVNEGTCS